MKQNSIVYYANSFIESHYEYLKIEEERATERALMIADLERIVNTLKAESEIRKEYFKNHFRERERLFSSAQSTLDHAIKIGDPKVAEIALEMIKIVKEKKVF